VSGSSGRLVISGPRDLPAAGEPTWPGQVFEDPECAYDEAMRTFVQRSAPCTPLLNPEREEQRLRHEAAEQVTLRELRRQERALALHRGQLNQQRQQEDAAWRALSQARRERERPYHATREEWAAFLLAAEQWRALRAQRHATLARRWEEDAQWRAERQRLREQLAPLQPRTSWIAILVLTDNCTRQCLGLPLFVAGPKVTAELVIAALRVLLPAELQFLISDRGTHFTAHQFARFAKAEGFVHVLIARHRPESNGIAERFVRTLKEWLAARIWSDAASLEALLAQFRAEYNDRPHQGIAIPGLSPDEFARRFWLL
jgi:transposase InsO family protein